MTFVHNVVFVHKWFTILGAMPTLPHYVVADEGLDSKVGIKGLSMHPGNTGPIPKGRG